MNDFFARWKKAIITIASVISAVGVIAGAVYGVEREYTPRDYTQRVEARLDLKIMRDERNSLEARLWKLDDRYPNPSTTIKETMRSLELDIQILDERIRAKTHAVGGDE